MMLGELKDIFYIRRSILIKRLTTYVFLCLLVGVMVVGIIGGVATTDLARTSMTLVALGALVVAVGYTLYILYMLWQRPRLKVYENGIAYQTRSDEKSWTWDDLTRIGGFMANVKQYGFDVGKTGAWSVYQGDERAFQISAFHDRCWDVYDRVVAEISKRLLPPAIRAFETGETLTFGQIVLDQQQLTLGRQKILWSKVHSFKSVNAWLYIYRHRRLPLRHPIHTIPNYFLLRQLLTHILRNRPWTES